MEDFAIGNRKIGDGYPAYIIAEMSANHAGSIERAKEIIRAAKEAGADCIKIQTYTPDTMTIDCDNENFMIKQGLWDGDSLYRLYKKAYTPWEWQSELKAEAERVGIDFFSTPFDKTSVDFLEELNVEFYKIASFELVDIPLIEYVASKGKPMILSTGMATLHEIEDAVKAIEASGNNSYALLKCASAYPAVSEEMNLNTIADMKRRFCVPIGLSDHSMGSVGAVTAVAMGANIIEKHFCISREIENPDAAFSMTKEEFKQMVQDIRDAEKAKGCVTYGLTKQEEENIIFRRSVFTVKNIKKGEVFDNTNIRVIRPGYGVKPKFYKDILGKTATRDIERGTPMRFDMFTDWISPRIDEKSHKILLLTNNDNAIRLYEGLRELDVEVTAYSGKLTMDMLEKVKPELIISYNYVHIITPDIVQKYRGKIVNMHISLLPWNKGKNPNFWSFYENTPKGVTIHFVDEGLDTGNIIVQREMFFDENTETFRSTYDKLNKEIVKLFLENYDDICHMRISGKVQLEKGNYHSQKLFDELNSSIHVEWDENISDFKKRISGENN